MKATEEGKIKMRVAQVLFMGAITLSTFTASAVLAGDPPNPPNPYEEGVKHPPLTDEDRASLLEFANTSKNKLEQALQQANDEAPDDALKVYLDAIMDVVAASFQEHRRSELLMRFALNQAMELTYGIPQADGSKPEKPGVLAQSQNFDLIKSIFENSIQLAIKYYTSDRQAIESGKLIDLPYIAFAQDHLERGKIWLAGINSKKEMLEFETVLLNQWQTTVNQEDHLMKDRIASPILKLENALKKLKNSGYTRFQKLSYLRGVIAETLNDVKGSGVLPTGNNSVPAADAKNLAPLSVSDDITKATFVSIPAGTFQMGSAEALPGSQSDENLHSVKLMHDFEIQATDITQAQWERVNDGKGSKTRPNPSARANCPHCPVDSVSWNDVQIFVKDLNNTANDGYVYSLPTEAQWEFAARAGTNTPYQFPSSQLGEYAWYRGNSEGQSHEVGSRNPIHYWPGGDLYDMYGNVWQWTLDVYDPNYSSPAEGPNRVSRGGSWNSFEPYLRAAKRNSNTLDDREPTIGARLVRTKREAMAKLPPLSIDEDITKATFVPIRAGTFQMGSTTKERYNNEEERHFVPITQDFEIQATDITQAQWTKITGNNPSNHVGCSDCPVESIEPREVAEFINRLNKTATDGYVYRLPTQEEWEYVARGGSDSDYPFPSGQIADYAWIKANSANQTHAVATRKPIRWPNGDLFDILGNVSQIMGGNRREGYSIRGSTFDGDGVELRLSWRHYRSDSSSENSTGARLVRTRK